LYTLRSSRNWLIATILTTLLLASLGIIANAAADIYGLFREPTHRSLSIYGDERLAKYLLSTRYVQANFDGALIGTSASSNWNTGRMQSLRLYNESLNGGNIVEERAILGQLLLRPGLKAVVLVVHPYITLSHDFKTVTLSPREVWGALGSKNLLEAYKSVINIRLGREPQLFDAAGTESYGEGTKMLNEHLRVMMRPGAEFAIDPIALSSYRDVVATLHAKRIPIAFVIPPTSEPILASKRAEFARYAATMLAERLPDDPVLDFNDDEFEPLRKDLSQFADGVHLRDSAAAKLTRLIDDHMRTWIAAGWLDHK
jgi:hypothetical protein